MKPNRSNHHEWPSFDYACCANCKFFWADKFLGGIADSHDCRRFPPQFIIDKETPDETFTFPLVMSDNWCGEWKSD